MVRAAQSKRERRGYKGVRMRKWGKWVAEVRQPNSRDRIWLGSYDTAQEAARAYDAAVFCLRGPSAVFNFPDDPPPDVMLGAELSPSQIQLVASKHAQRAVVGGAEGAVGELKPPVVAVGELKPPVVENLFFQEAPEMGESSFCAGFLAADGRGGEFFDESHVWNFSSFNSV